MVWVQIGTQTGRPKVGLEGVGQQLLPHPLFLAASQMKMQFVPARHGQNTLIYQIMRENIAIFAIQLIREVVNG